MKKREFLKKAGAGTVAAVTATAVNAPYVHAQSKTPIKWRLQTYAGPALAAHVIKPSIDAFNKIANGEMTIELFLCRSAGSHRRAVQSNAEGHNRRRAK